MEKTTVYLPNELKASVRRVAQRRGVSRAEVIREAIRSYVGANRPHPTGPLYDSGQPLAADVDQYLKGFGER